MEQNTRSIRPSNWTTQAALYNENPKQFHLIHTKKKPSSIDLFQSHPKTCHPSERERERHRERERERERGRGREGEKEGERGRERKRARECVREREGVRESRETER